MLMPFLIAALVPSLTSCGGLPVRPVISEAEQQQYRAWMEVARRRYPYSESVSRMWKLMLCESAGKSNAAHSGTYGLFQYRRETWKGAWNPYRRKSIYDPRAQIFATAQAWHDGHQSWWHCS